ncbi:MAG: diaminopimelate epimerase [Bacteroidetes bacterium SW_9_63_38]|nr:MAG: diaminopimelate epimerase [Bacteroidetes bacterium SW_9_63_38]
MSPSLVVEFTKMHGTGNDFIVLDNRWYRFSDEELSDLAATWCPRRYGVGADGLLALTDTEEEGVDYRMRYVNADGSWATMCGNGARCLARFALDADFEGPSLTFDTDAGRYRATEAEGESRHIRLFVPPAEDLELDMTLDEDPAVGPDAVHYVNTGTGHLVLFVSDIAAVPVQEWAPPLRHDARVHPPGANVNFVEVEEETLRMRTFEKGVEDETLSCGTGVLAAAVVAQAAGQVSASPLTIETQGGAFEVGTASTSRGEEQYLQGPVDTVFRGSLNAT